MQQRRKLIIVALVVAILTVGVGTATVAAASRSKVARHVTLADKSIAGLSEAKLTENSRVPTPHDLCHAGKIVLAFHGTDPEAAVFGSVVTSV